MSGHGFHYTAPTITELNTPRKVMQSMAAVTPTRLPCSPPSLPQWVPSSYMGGATQGRSGLFKNNAAIKKDRSV